MLTISPRPSLEAIINAVQPPEAYPGQSHLALTSAPLSSNVRTTEPCPPGPPLRAGRSIPLYFSNSRQPQDSAGTLQPRSGSDRQPRPPLTRRPPAPLPSRFHSILNPFPAERA